MKECSQSDVSDKQMGGEEQTSNENDSNKTQESNVSDTESVKHELNLLAKLIGRDTTNDTEIEFWLNLGNDQNSDEKQNEIQNNRLNELRISDGIHTNKSLENIINDLNFEENQQNNDTSDGNDLLELMDS